jgi:hypothetical protein
MKRKARGVKRDGSAYDCLFDAASGFDETIKRGASLDDTIAMLPEKVRAKKHQADRIAVALKDIDDRVSRTAYNIWKFLTDYIAYVPDERGKEQVRSVRRLWSDKIGDCDCFSFFTSCVLSVLKIPHKLRIASYDKVNGTFGHVYVVVSENDKEIIIDAVKDRFNDEHPYEKIKDINMDLEFLDGIDPEDFARNGGMSFDAQDLFSHQLPNMNNDLGRLNIFDKAKDKIKTTAQNIKTNFQNAGQKVKETASKVGSGVSKGLHVINRVNPATAALRLGILSAMKLNLFKVAENLRYAYLSDSEAQKRGINMKRFERYKRTRERLEKTFFSAGGKPENLKEAILTGKGNQDKAVALSGYALQGLGFTGSSSIREIIGEDIYADEYPAHEPGLSGLGAIATGAAVTAASGIIATIAGILKNIGPLFEKGEPGADEGFEQLEKEAGAAERAVDDGSTTEDSGTAPAADAPPEGEGESWMDKAKAWAIKNKTPLIVAGISLLAVGGIWAYNKYGKSKSTTGRRAETTDGIPRGAKGRVRSSDGRTKKGRNEKILRDLRLSRMK